VHWGPAAGVRREALLATADAQAKYVTVLAFLMRRRLPLHFPHGEALVVAMRRLVRFVTEPAKGSKLQQHAQDTARDLVAGAAQSGGSSGSGACHALWVQHVVLALAHAIVETLKAPPQGFLGRPRSARPSSASTCCCSPCRRASPSS